MSQFNSSNNWIIVFKESFVVSRAFGLTLHIKGKAYQLFDANEDQNPYKTQQFRLHWLPYGFETSKVKSFMMGFSKSIEIISIDEEYCRDDGMTHIKTGNIRIKIRFLKKDEVNVNTGVHKIDGFRTLLTRIGEKPKCLLCNKEGHVKRECELSKLKCNRCLKIGHIDASCNFANQLKSQTIQENLSLPNEDYDLQNETFPRSLEAPNIEKEIIDTEFQKDLKNDESNNNFSARVKELKQAVHPNRRNSETARTNNQLKANNSKQQNATPSTSTSSKRTNAEISPIDNKQKQKKEHSHPSILSEVEINKNQIS